MDAGIVIHHYDPVWPELFERERVRLLARLGDWVTLEHIGSTAVPGLAAKPCVDVLAGVAHFKADADPCTDTLLADGWRARPEPVASDQRWFYRPGSAHDTYHLHLVERDSALWHEHLLFRDYLRRHSRAGLIYQQLKHVLAARSADRAAYSEGKAGFVGSIVALARADRAQGRL